MTPLQQRFADEYLADLNATAAYQRAGGRAKGHSAESAAHQLLRNNEVAAYIEAKKKERAKETGITAKRVLDELAKLAFADPRNLYDRHGKLKSIPDLDEATAASVIAFDVHEVTEETKLKKVRLSDKRAALELLARHLGLFNDKLKIEGEVHVSVYIPEQEKPDGGS